MQKIIYIFLLSIVIGSQTACATVNTYKDQVTRIPYNYTNLPGWKHGDQLGAFGSLKKSCSNLTAQQAKNNKWLDACNNILASHVTSNSQAQKLLEKYFTPYLIKYENSVIGFFTGYYEPLVKGSLVKTSEYNIPIYAKPDNLVRTKLASGKIKYGRIVNGKLVPYYTRQQIAQNNYLNKTDVLVWVHDRIERSFLQIQGSGRILLSSGKTMLIGYAGQNGLPYRPIGRLLLNMGEIPKADISMQSIKTWLYANPSKADKILDYDPSFVFFRISDSDNPVGAEGVELTPGRSLAVDWRYTSYGTPVWIDTTYKAQDGKNHTLQRLMVAQDTGGAIRGANRADVFWGHGNEAEYNSGYMKHSGKMWVLLPK